MKVVIDTNIVISAAWRDRIPEKVILFVAQQPDFEWVATPEIITEYNEVLKRPKFNMPADLLAQWAQMFDALVSVVNIPNALEFPRDQKDAKFLECALVSDADFFITGDKDFEDAQKIIRTKIVSVTLFHKLLVNPDG